MGVKEGQPDITYQKGAVSANGSTVLIPSRLWKSFIEVIMLLMLAELGVSMTTLQLTEHKTTLTTFFYQCTDNAEIGFMGYEPYIYSKLRHT